MAAAGKWWPTEQTKYTNTTIMTKIQRHVIWLDLQITEERQHCVKEALSQHETWLLIFWYSLSLSFYLSRGSFLYFRDGRQGQPFHSDSIRTKKSKAEPTEKKQKAVDYFLRSKSSILGSGKKPRFEHIGGVAVCHKGATQVLSVLFFLLSTNIAQHGMLDMTEVTNFVQCNPLIMLNEYLFLIHAKAKGKAGWPHYKFVFLQKYQQ